MCYAVLVLLCYISYGIILIITWPRRRVTRPRRSARNPSSKGWCRLSVWTTRCRTTRCWPTLWPNGSWRCRCSSPCLLPVSRSCPSGNPVENNVILKRLVRRKNTILLLLLSRFNCNHIVIVVGNVEIKSIADIVNRVWSGFGRFPVERLIFLHVVLLRCNTTWLIILLPIIPKIIRYIVTTTLSAH